MKQLTKMKGACNCIKGKIFKLHHCKLESLVLEMNEFESMQLRPFCNIQYNINLKK